MTPRLAAAILRNDCYHFRAGGKTMNSQVTQEADVEIDEVAVEEVLVHAWRVEQLWRLGVARTVAEEFAGFVDWHEIAELVERGCSPKLALEIVR
jgi:hypothetical protein